jgi:hypothetical protein
LSFDFRNPFSVFVSSNVEAQLVPKAFIFMSSVLIKLERDILWLGVFFLLK